MKIILGTLVFAVIIIVLFWFLTQKNPIERDYVQYLYNGGEEPIGYLGG